MKFQVYGGSKDEPEKVVMFQLVQSGDDVLLQVVDNEGRRVPSSTVLVLSSKQGVQLLSYLSPGIGLPLDESRRIKQY